MKEKKIKQVWLAAEAGISAAMVSDVVKGKKKFSFSKMEAVARALGYPIYEFLGIGQRIIDGERPEIKTQFPEISLKQSGRPTHAQDKSDIILEKMDECLNVLRGIAVMLERDFKRKEDPLSDVGEGKTKEGA